MRRKNSLRPVFTLAETSVLLRCPVVAPSEEQTEDGPPLACLVCRFFGSFFSTLTFHSPLSGLQKSFRYANDKLQSSFLPVILSTVSSYPPSVGQRKREARLDVAAALVQCTTCYSSDLCIFDTHKLKVGLSSVLFSLHCSCCHCRIMTQIMSMSLQSISHQVQQ